MNIRRTVLHVSECLACVAAALQSLHCSQQRAVTPAPAEYKVACYQVHSAEQPSAHVSLKRTNTLLRLLERNAGITCHRMWAAFDTPCRLKPLPMMGHRGYDVRQDADIMFITHTHQVS